MGNLALLSLCLALVLLRASYANEKLVIFGDSLSDNGNALALTGGTFPPSPYGHTYNKSGKDLGDTFPGRFTDGGNWVDYFPRVAKCFGVVESGALVGLTISFAPPAFAQKNDAVDAETAQQVRALASNYDAAFNRQDAVTIAGLYAENAVFNTPEGTFHGRKAIEELYAKHYFGEAHSKSVLTVVNEAIAVGEEVHATGTWSDTFEEPSTGTIHAEGTYSWVLLHEGDTWRIRESTYNITNMR